MKYFQITLTIILIISSFILIWVENELNTIDSTIHFDGQSGIGLMVMLFLQYGATIFGLLIFIISIFIGISKKKFTTLNKINILLSIVCVFLAVWFL